ncbi:GtrA family protein [Massilia sp. YIM B02769]|uniref:GtrA family protein n=1 Tax=Massilia sp. YIM B02769 TaxID=3050129 RepID=UPI0025B6F2A8|nr:GtrA family protein [Massilia sp. YIM B02769]MDN4061357.1 GtrA family protein [Massilia sp. YIM B02769]
MIRRELKVFLIVGSLTVLIDFLSYRALLWSALVPVGGAKAAGFLIGTAFAYFANRAWTFGSRPHRPGSAWRFALLYAVTLGANVAVNGAVLRMAGGFDHAVQLAFLAATGVSTCLNFLGMKLFVFRAHTQPEAS